VQHQHAAACWQRQSTMCGSRNVASASFRGSWPQIRELGAFGTGAQSGRKNPPACLSVCLPVTTVSPAKMAELIEMPLWKWTLVRAGNGTFEGDDVGIFPHAVDQHSTWPTTEAVECHIKFSQWKSYSVRHLVKIVWTPLTVIVTSLKTTRTLQQSYSLK